MRIVLFGATGMVGKGVLHECLDAPDVEQVIAVGRSPAGMTHAKLVEVIHKDFTDFTAIEDRLRGADACFFCLGVSSSGMKEPEYTKITYDTTLAAARSMLRASPNSVLTYVSGAGTDSSEKGRSMWARVKGRTENALLAMPFGGAYMFRPGLIKPERGIVSKTPGYANFYKFGGSALASVLLKVAPGSTTSTSRMGLAMLECAATKPRERILETKDINRLAEARAARKLGAN